MKNIIFIIISSVLLGTVPTFIFGYWQAKRQSERQLKDMIEMSKHGVLGEIEARGGFPWKFFGYGLVERFNLLNFIFSSILMSFVVFIIATLILFFK